MEDKEFVMEKLDLTDTEASKVYETWEGNEVIRREANFKEYVDGWVSSLSFEEYVEYMCEMCNSVIFKAKNGNYIICGMW